MPTISTEELFADSENTGARTISTAELFGDQQSAPKAKKPLLPTEERIKDIARAGHPVLAAVAGIGKDIGTIGAHAVNQLGFNYPRSIASSMGYEYPVEAGTKAGQIGANTAGIAGAIFSPLNKIGAVTMAGRAARGASLGVRALSLGKKVATGAALAAAYAPNEDVVGLKQRGQQAIGGAVIPLAGAGIGKVLGTVKGYINPEAVSALTKAIKPGKWNKNFPSDAAIALPIIKQAGQTVNNIDDFVGATAVAKTNTWNKIDKLLKQAGGDTKVSHNYEDILARAKQLKEEAIGEYSGTAEFIDNFRNITSGIKPYSKAINGKRFLAEELKSVPSKFKNVNGLYLDEAVTSYNNAFGTKYTTNEFTQLLKDHGSVKLPSSNIKDYVSQANRDLSEYFGDSLIDGDMIAKKLRGTVKPESIKLSPEIGDAVNTVANKYEKIPVSIMEAEDRLQQLNSELTGFFKSSPRSGYIKEQQSEVAALLAERKILRSELYDKIQSLTGTDIAPLKKQYGALMNIQDEALGRMNVASRQAPVSLQQAINGLFGLAKAASGDMSGLLQIGGASAIKRWNSTDFLIRKAVQNTGKLSLGNRVSNAVPAFYKNAASSDFNKPLPPAFPLKKALGNQAGGIGKGQKYKVAFDIDGKIYKGNTGEIHSQLLNRLPKQVQSRYYELMDSSNSGFVDGFVDNKGEYLTRFDAQMKTGVDVPNVERINPNFKKRLGK